MRRRVGVFDENLLNYQVVRISVMWGGAVASGLVRSTPDWVVRVRALAGVIVLRSLARHFTLTVLLFTQVYKWVPANVLGKPCDKLASHPVGSRNTPSRFMLRKPELSTGSMGHLGSGLGFTRISVRCYFPRLDYQTLFRKWACANPQSHGRSPLYVNKMRRQGKRCISFSGSIWPPKGHPFHWFPFILCEQFHFFFFFLHARFYCFSRFETSHEYNCFICKYLSVPIKHSFKQQMC